jgi:glycosyltransferase involved in cell wall biosynthesis
MQTQPKIMYLDMAYTLRTVRERDLSQEFLSRDCGGFFEHVWGVHPIADVPHDAPLPLTGFRPHVVAFAPNQTIIEGSSGYYAALRRLYPVNFVVSQIRFLVYLAALIKREKISVMVSTDPYLCGLYGLALKYLTNTPLVIWVLANYADVADSTGKAIMPRLFRTRWIERQIERIVFRCADLVAGGNRDNLEFALRNGANANRSTVFPVAKTIHLSHRIDPKLRAIDPVVPRTGGKVFVYVGRLLETKFPDDVVRAFAAIRARHADATLVMVGDGPMREVLETLAADLGLSDSVRFTGNVGQQRLSEILAGCYAALSPLTGRALIEVALAGLPVVVYDRDWQKEFVDGSSGGRVVPFRDWHKMGEFAAGLAADPDAARALGENARRAALDMCDLTGLYRHEQQVYQTLLR